MLAGPSCGLATAGPGRLPQGLGHSPLCSHPPSDPALFPAMSDKALVQAQPAQPPAPAPASSNARVPSDVTLPQGPGSDLNPGQACPCPAHVGSSLAVKLRLSSRVRKHSCTKANFWIDLQDILLRHQAVARSQVPGRGRAGLIQPESMLQLSPAWPGGSRFSCEQSCPLPLGPSGEVKSTLELVPAPPVAGPGVGAGCRCTGLRTHHSPVYAALALQVLHARCGVPNHLQQSLHPQAGSLRPKEGQEVAPWGRVREGSLSLLWGPSWPG